MKMIQDLGSEQTGLWSVHYAIYECPDCGNHFRANVSDIKRRRKRNCGCVISLAALPEEINGCKIIKDLGTKETGRRRAMVQCPLCTNQYDIDLASLRLNAGRKNCGNHKRPREAKPPKAIIKRVSSNLFENPIIQAMTKDELKTLKFTHGSMIARCYRPTHPKYHRYGGRGIKVCDRWRCGYYYFAIDIGKRPEGRLSLDRVNNDGDYQLDNIRWATDKEQQNNRCNNVKNANQD